MSATATAEHEPPVHPGAILRHLFMPSARIEPLALANIMKTSIRDLEELLDERRSLSKSDVDHLAESYAELAITLQRAQALWDFFTTNHRQPSIREKAKLLQCELT